MKSIILLVAMAMSSSAFSVEANSVDTFLSILPLGVHTGKNFNSNNCSVNIVETDFPSHSIAVEITTPRKKLFKLIKEGCLYSFSEADGYYSQATRHYVDETRSAYVDRMVSLRKKADQSVEVIIVNENIIGRDHLIESANCILKK